MKEHELSNLGEPDKTIGKVEKFLRRDAQLAKILQNIRKEEENTNPLVNKYFSWRGFIVGDVEEIPINETYTFYIASPMCPLTIEDAKAEEDEIGLQAALALQDRFPSGVRLTEMIDPQESKIPSEWDIIVTKHEKGRQGRISMQLFPDIPNE